MKAYFDMFSGISGNMTLGALIELGVKPEDLKSELSKLGLDDEFRIETKRVLKNGISGTYVNVALTHEAEHHHEHEHECEHHHEHEHEHECEHHHEHEHECEHHHEHRHEHVHGRSLSEIAAMIENSELSENVKKKSVRIFTNLGKAEAKIHATDIENIHFHEVGAVDAIVDIVGSVIGMELLGIDEIYASPVHTGTGFVFSAHGKIPVPAPATLELLGGFPAYSTGIAAELTTPTGAAIITTLAKEFGPRPGMEVVKTGYGAGSRDLEIPNLLRVSLMKESDNPGFRTNYVNVVETNVDDMNPEFYDHIMEKLFSVGALDVFMAPVQMKKNRPATKLTVLTGDGAMQDVVKVILSETTTLGIRVHEKVRRYCLDRKVETVKTEWGEARVKLALSGEKVSNVSPEYEDCKKIAQERDIPVKTVYFAVLDAYRNRWRS